jgi:hypothetical protein
MISFVQISVICSIVFISPYLSDCDAEDSRHALHWIHEFALESAPKQNPLTSTTTEKVWADPYSAHKGSNALDLLSFTRWATANMQRLMRICFYLDGPSFMTALICK